MAEMMTEKGLVIGLIPERDQPKAAPEKEEKAAEEKTVVKKTGRAGRTAK